MFSPPLARHETRLWLANPATVVFLGFAWAMLAVLGFKMGEFFAGNRAGLEVFFSYLPWVYALMLPALTMGLWAEDARKGAAERMLTLPVTVPQWVVTRFGVAWGLVGVFLLGTWPLVASVAWLGNPDWGQMAAGYVGAFLLGGAMLACAMLASAACRHAVVAFVVGVTVLVFLLLSGWSWLLDTLAAYTPNLVIVWLRDVSLLEHVRRFNAGMLDIRSVTYMLALTLLGLGGQTAILLRRMGRGSARVWGAGSLVLAVALAAGANVLPLRGDWTHEGQFTLSPASVHLLENLPKPVTITVYESRTNPDVPLASRITARRLEDILREVKAINPSSIRLEAINPDLNVDDEVLAQEAGLVEQPLEMAGQGFYLGLVAEMDGRHAIIPVVEASRLPYLEFDLMSILAEVQKLGRKTVSVLAIPNLRMRDLQPTWLRELEGYYNVNYLLPGTPKVPDDTHVLVVMMAPYLPMESLYAIDQYLTRGGRVMLLMDPYFRTAPTAETQAPDRNADAFAFDHPADLLRGWGVQYDGQSIVGDPARAATINEPELGFRTYPFWLQLRATDINPDLPFTTFVESLNLPEAGHFTLGTMAPGLTATKILTTTPLAQTISRSTLDGADLQLAPSQASGTPSSKVVAMMLAGTFPSLFKDIPPTVMNTYLDMAPQGASPSIPPHQARGTGQGAILAIADEDFMNEKFTVRPSGRVEGEMEPMNDNLVFFFNALQYLAGEGDLLALRGKAAVPRTFTTVEAMLARLSNSYAKIERTMAADLFQVGAKLQELKKQQEGEGTQSLQTVAQSELRAYQTRNLALKKQLRDVRKSLRRDVLMVEKVLLVFTALAMPLLAGFVWMAWRRRRLANS